MNKNTLTANYLPKKIGQTKKAVRELTEKYRNPVLGVALHLLFILAVAALPAIAQGPNPFGGTSGTTRLSSVGSNILVIATWLALFIGLLSFVLIPVFIKFGMDYKKLVASGLTGLGGFVIIGSIAYDIVNLSTISISDPGL